MTDAAQERIIEAAIAALRLIDVFTEAELEEARERMRRIQDDPTHRRIADHRVEGGSGP